MKYFLLSIFIVLLTGCGSDSKKDSTEKIYEIVSIDEFKKNFQTVVDDSGVTYRVMTVDSNSDTTIRLDENEVFLLASGDDFSEKLVVQGKVTIK